MFKCSRILSLTAFVFGGIGCANASRILLLGSYGMSTALNPGVGNSATIYDPADSLIGSNGDYIDKTDFLISSTVLADVTASGVLNNHLIFQLAGSKGPGKPHSHCSKAGSNCAAPATFAFSGLQAGLNQLEFDVKQVNDSNEDIDFSDSIGSFLPDPPSVPEPLPLALFGTGILGLFGVSRRYGYAE